MGTQTLTVDRFEFNNGNEKACFDSWPCEGCLHSTYKPGYYTDTSLVCFACSVFDCTSRWCQFAKKR